MSGRPGWAPTAMLCALQARTVECIIRGSPAWKPFVGRACQSLIGPGACFLLFFPFSAGKASMMWAGVVDCVLLRIERMCIPLTTCDLFSPFLLVSCYLHKATLCLTLQLTFAWSINGISSSSGPHLKFPYPSPRSTLMCTLRPIGAILIGKEMLKTVEHNEFTSKERIAG